VDGTPLADNPAMHPRPKPGDLNFAYGSNLERWLMEQRCRVYPVTCAGRASLHGYTLAFEGFPGEPFTAYATVHRSDRRNARVDGLLYRLSGPEWEALDACEGVPRLYRREQVAVQFPSGADVVAWTYMHNGGVYALPSLSYIRGIGRGCTAEGIADGRLTAAVLNAYRLEGERCRR